MRVHAAILSGFLMVAGAVTGSAQQPVLGVPVESSLTFALRIDMAEVNDGGAIRSTNLRRMSLTTKDIMDLVSDILNRRDIRSLALRRITNPADVAPDHEVLGANIVFLDGDRNPIEVGAAVLERQLDLDELSRLFERRAASVQIRRDAGVVSRQIRALEAAELRILGGDNHLQLGLFGVDTANARRRFERQRDLGLFFGSRIVEVNGGVDLDVDSIALSDRLDGRGVLRGTVRAGAERRLDDR